MWLKNIQFLLMSGANDPTIPTVFKWANRKGPPGFESRTRGRGEGGVLGPLKKFTTWAKNHPLGSQFRFWATLQMF